MRVKIEKLVYGGEGLAHADGRTLFVPFVLPDEVAAVRLTEQKKKFARGRVESLVEASPARVVARCPHFTRCGGCHYQHIPYEAQLAYKQTILRESLQRLGRVEWEGPLALHASPPFGYRNRAQWKVRRAGSDAPPAIGYFEAGSSALCAVEECAVLSPRLAETLAALRGMLGRGLLGALVEIEAFADAEDRQMLLTASFSSLEGAAPESVARLLREELAGIESILLHDASRDRFELIGPGFLKYGVGEAVYRVGHLSFFQVNRFLLAGLVEAVTGGAQGKLAIDLFAGVGLFSVGLLRNFARVVAVEGNPAAARDLGENLRAAAATAQGHAADGVNQEAESFLAQHRETPDLLVLDPPRAGLSQQLVRQTLSLAPPEIRYLSCDPATLARDLGALSPGYEINEISLFDLFPQTYHLETLVRLKRRG
jgi:23S rRNA (uracil1939-C5)-methyltransferase